MAAITVAVYLQGLKLAQMEKQVVETAWLGSKESELRHYVSLAYSAVAPLQEAGDDRPRASGRWTCWRRWNSAATAISSSMTCRAGT